MRCDNVGENLKFKEKAEASGMGITFKTYSTRHPTAE